MFKLHVNAMIPRQNISSGGKFEKVVGYSRAVKFGSMIFVSGTTGTDSTGSLVSDNDSYAQARQAIQNIQSALEKADASLKDVVQDQSVCQLPMQTGKILQRHISNSLVLLCPPPACLSVVSSIPRFW